MAAPQKIKLKNKTSRLEIYIKFIPLLNWERTSKIYWEKIWKSKKSSKNLI